MKATTERRTKRLADLAVGDVIRIDRDGHTAVIESNKPHSYAPFRARGMYETTFDMGPGFGKGGWTGNGASLIEIVASADGGAR